MEGLDDVKKELEAKRQALAQELDSAVGKVASIEKDMKRVDDAIRALTKGKARGRKRTEKAEETVTEAEPFASGIRDLSGGTGFDPFPH